MRIHRHHLALAAILVGGLLAAPASARHETELIEFIADDAGITVEQAERALDGFVGATTSALKKGDRVALVGFGSFSVSKRARTGRNPQTGKEIKIAAKTVGFHEIGENGNTMRFVFDDLPKAKVHGHASDKDPWITTSTVVADLGTLTSGDPTVEPVAFEFQLELPASMKPGHEAVVVELPLAPFAQLAEGDPGIDLGPFEGATYSHPAPLLTYLPIAHPELADQSADGDLEGTADALGLCEDAFDVDRISAPGHHEPPFTPEHVCETIGAKAGISAGEACRVIDSLLHLALTDDGGKKAKARKKGLTLVGFGSFSCSKRSARTGRNPQTGATIRIPAKRVVKFKAGADLAGKVN